MAGEARKLMKEYWDKTRNRPESQSFLGLMSGSHIDNRFVYEFVEAAIAETREQCAQIADNEDTGCEDTDDQTYPRYEQEADERVLKELHPPPRRP